MSFIRFAARISAVEATKGNTVVGSNVLDSEIGVLDIAADGSLRTDKDKQFISVYTDSSKGADGLELRSLLSPGLLDIVFESGVATAHAITDSETDESVILGMPATDATLEFLLDFALRQTGDALNDPENEWAAIFLSLCHSFQSVSRSRISGDTNGMRLAAHQLKIVANMVAEPLRGVPLNPSSPFAKFLAKCESDLVPNDPSMAEKIALIRAQLSGNVSELQTAMRRYGLIHNEADAMLITPYEGSP
ncbi:hypothetical protein [Agrobacterium pusense]|uniref:hypothetical protein n=1 Tax=Agrobacterium pusense TaxID=648995 RepID=UPI002F3FB143